VNDGYDERRGKIEGGEMLEKPQRRRDARGGGG